MTVPAMTIKIANERHFMLNVCLTLVIRFDTAIERDVDGAVH
jgi:hypothetical protein